MKKSIFSFISATLVASALCLSSCSGEDTAEALNVNTSKTATVKGILHADYDITNVDVNESVPPTGTKVTLQVNYTDLNSGASSGVYTVNAYTDAKGNYSASVPVKDGGAYIKIVADEFDSEVKTGVDKKENRKFKVTVSSVTGQPGMTVYVPVANYISEKYQ